MAQNLFPNPGFEQYLSCPTYTSQINRCSSWDSATGTADFYHCGYYAPSTLGNYGTPRSGSGLIGLICSPPNIFVPGTYWYGETFKGRLNQTLVPGATYRLNSYWLIATTNLPATSGNCYSIGFYFYKSVHAPPMPITGCLNVRPQVRFDPSALQVSNYVPLNMDFTADSCYDAVMIGLFCNDSTFGTSCMQTGDAEYYNVDDISLVKLADPAPGYSAFSAGKTEICVGDCVSFSDLSQRQSTSRTWYFEGASTPSANDSAPANICYPQAGLFDVTFVNRYECGSDSLVKAEYIRVGEKPSLTLITDTSILCYGLPRELKVESNSPFTWSTGETSGSIYVRYPGLYFVTAENQCGRDADSAEIVYENCACSVWVPNAFTPNSDTKNERYRAVSDCVFRSFSMDIFNRWGQKLFSSTQPDQGWDGRYSQTEAPEGIYVARIRYEGYDEGRAREKVLTQTLLLIR